MNTRVLAALCLVLGLYRIAPVLAADQVPSSTTAVTQVIITDVSPVPSESTHSSLYFPYSQRFPSINPEKRDDLQTLRELAGSNDLPFKFNRAWSIITSVGKSARLEQQPLLPQRSSVVTSGVPQKPTDSATAPESLTVTSSTNSDKTVTIELHLNVYPIDGRPNGKKLSLLTTRTFTSGETQMIGAAFPSDYPVRLYFVTVKLVPAKKG